MIKADVKKFYGWDWPDGMGLRQGAKALFDFLILKQAQMRQRG